MLATTLIALGLVLAPMAAIIGGGAGVVLIVASSVGVIAGLFQAQDHRTLDRRELDKLRPVVQEHRRSLGR